VLHKKYEETFRGKLLYDDKHFITGNNDDIKDNVFFHVDKNKTFYGKEEYFTSKDMVVVSSWDNK
jgi:hypothetical protein